MKKIFFLVLFMAAMLFGKAQSLSGIVMDSTSHQTLPGAVVYLPELQLGATVDAKGYYTIPSVPNGNLSVEVEFLGYSTITKQISIKGDTKINFKMGVSSSAAKEVVITALGNVTNTLRSPVPVTLVSHDFILQQSSNNAIDAIASKPGISEVTTGPGVSKPEINGLGFNRVLTLFDGERQEDFQWGDEHGILIDPYAVYDAEIIRGPASLEYGANAEAGVISFKSEPFPEDGTIKGSVLSEYQTNDGMIGTSVNIAGNNNGLVWNIRGSNEEAHCYSDPKDGYVWGTANNQGNIRGVIGLNKKWGYSRLSISLLHRQVEIPDGNRDSTGQFEFDFPQSNGQLYPTKANYLSYNPNIAGYQVLNHDELWWQNNINVGLGRIGADVGYSQSSRQEIDSGNVAAENMTVRDIPYSFKYQIAGDSSGLKLTTGINGMYEFENNAPEPAAPYIGDFEIPNYNDFDIGGYAVLDKDYKNLTISGGLRYDFRSMIGQSMYLANYDTPEQTAVPSGTSGAFQQFGAFNRTYTGLSGSLGASYQLPDNNYLKINFAKSYRAPSISELTSNELDPANIYRLGDPNLKAEQGYEADFAYGYNGRNINFEMDAFSNYIQNFIFPSRINSKSGGDSLDLGEPVFKYQAFNAIISGVTVNFNIHPADTKWIEVDNGFTYIYSFILNQTDSTQHVPFTPAPHLTTDVKFKLHNHSGSIFKDTYFKIGTAKYWAQNDIYSALWNELPSYAYTLYNLGLGTDFVNPKTGRVICSFYMNVTNLTNLAYVDHTSREQYFLTNNGVDAIPVTQQSQGIYNMGRNIGFKLVFPF